MALTLEQLIKISPIDEKIKERFFLEKDSLTEDDKFNIIQICWQTISVSIEARRQQKFDQMLKETADGGREYLPEDFTREEDAIIAEFLVKMDQQQTEQQMTDVKKELKKHLDAAKVTAQSDPSKIIH